MGRVQAGPKGLKVEEEATQRRKMLTWRVMDGVVRELSPCP
jgi:hypothetical protein